MNHHLALRDYVLVAAFCLMLFGYAIVSGRPLAMHEARLPQTAREMAAHGDYLFPHSGARPWLERPPLPHWAVIGVTTIFGHHDRILVVRLPSALCGTAIVLVTAWMAGYWFSRTIGLLSAFILATAFEFWTYSSLAEDDIYLALLVAIAMGLFVRAEWSDHRPAAAMRTRPFGARPWSLLLLFVVAGLTNLTKGPLVGLAIIGSTIAAFLIWNLDLAPFRRYAWVWGWAAMLAVTAAWPAMAILRYPDVLANWRFDYLGRVTGAYSPLNEPIWYYLVWVPLMLLPWTPEVVAGLVVTWNRVRRTPRSPERLLWCWAMVPAIVFSIPRGKHHHYLVPVLAPWAMIGALGTVHLWSTITRKWRGADGVRAMGTAVALLLVVYVAVQTFGTSRSVSDDTQFVREANANVPADKTLFINADVNSLDFFRLQFYSRDDAVLLHNLTFLRDDTIHDPDVYVITRARDEGPLAGYGSLRIEGQSPGSHGEPGPGGRFTLFHLWFTPGLQRYPAPTTITNLQGLLRVPGPFCGPPPGTKQD